MKTSTGSRAFTLTEMLVVISVVIILASMLVLCIDGLYTYAIRLQCQHRMEQLWSACLLYQSQERVLPHAWDFGRKAPWYDTLVESGYLDNKAVAYCPSAEDLQSTYGTGEGGYTPDGSDALVEAVMKALNWLNESHVPYPASGGVMWVAPCGWEWGTNSPVGAGFATLAYAGAGFGVNHAKFGATIRGALDNLVYASYQRNGDFAANMARHDEARYARAYINGVCTMAICDAYRLNGDVVMEGGRSLRDAAQKAADYLTSIQNWEGGFPYHTEAFAPTGYYSDMSANSWAWQGMASAAGAGLLDLSDEDAHHTDYYMDRCAELSGAGWYRASRIDTWDVHASDGNSRWRMTPAVLSSRLLVGMAPDDDRIQTQIAYINQNIDGRNTYMGLASGAFDLYAIYYMTLSLYIYGGEEWENWAEAFPAFVLANGRSVVSEDKHYWHTDGPGWQNHGSYAYPTALAAMCLEMAAAEHFIGSKYNRSFSGAHSYGYNKQIANDENGRRSPARDTIVLMDYLRDGIDYQDPIDYIVPRHDGKVNVMFADGHCEALAAEDLIEEIPNNPDEYRIKRQWLTLEAGSEGHLDED